MNSKSKTIAAVMNFFILPQIYIILDVLWILVSAFTYYKFRKKSNVH